MLSWSWFSVTPYYEAPSQKNVLEYHEKSISELLLAQGSFYSVYMCNQDNSWKNSYTSWASYAIAVGSAICEVLYGKGIFETR